MYALMMTIICAKILPRINTVKIVKKISDSPATAKIKIRMEQKNNKLQMENRIKNESFRKNQNIKIVPTINNKSPTKRLNMASPNSANSLA